MLAGYGGDGARFAEGRLGTADGLDRAGLVVAAQPNGGHIAIADGSQVITVDVRDPDRPEVRGRVTVKVPVTGLCLDGAGRIVVADREGVRRWPVGARSAAADGEYAAVTPGGHSLVVVAAGTRSACSTARAPSATSTSAPLSRLPSDAN